MNKSIGLQLFRFTQEAEIYMKHFASFVFFEDKCGQQLLFKPNIAYKKCSRYYFLEDNFLMCATILFSCPFSSC